MFRLKLLHEGCYNAIITVESAIVMVGFTYYDRENENRANEIINEELPFFAKKSKSIDWKLERAEAAIKMVKDSLLDGNTQAAIRGLSKNFPNVKINYSSLS